MTATANTQEGRYKAAIDTFGSALGRLVKGYEVNSERQRDLLQDIHIALWRSFAGFAGQCSVRTWVYRVAHNTAVSHLQREQRSRISRWVNLEEISNLEDGSDLESALHTRQAQLKLLALIQRLQPPDRQVIMLYLEDMDAAGISEITGYKPGHISTKIHRLKALLAQAFNAGAQND